MRTSALSVALAVVVACSGDLSAQTQYEFTGFAGAALFNSDLTDAFGSDQVVQSHDNALAAGLHAGIRFSQFSVEGTLAFVPTKITTSSGVLGVSVSDDQTILILGVHGVLNLEAGDFFEPFLVAGVGVKRYSADDPASPPGFAAGSDVMFDVGVGGRLWVTENVAVRVDLRDYLSTFDAFELLGSSGQSTKLQNDILLTVGLSVTGGGS